MRDKNDVASLTDAVDRRPELPSLHSVDPGVATRRTAIPLRERMHVFDARPSYCNPVPYSLGTAERHRLFPILARNRRPFAEVGHRLPVDVQGNPCAIFGGHLARPRVGDLVVRGPVLRVGELLDPRGLEHRMIFAVVWILPNHDLIEAGS